MKVLQQDLINRTYCLPGWCKQGTWIFAILWILTCITIVVIFGINFDIAAKNSPSPEIQDAAKTKCTQPNGSNRLFRK